ncbi:MAG: hypothetical protein MZV70_44840 [Desulfobacterales bacterium]|nr:hypothetical protein [Desulfobacterales bacterium]
MSLQTIRGRQSRDIALHMDAGRCREAQDSARWPTSAPSAVSTAPCAGSPAITRTRRLQGELPRGRRGAIVSWQEKLKLPAGLETAVPAPPEKPNRLPRLHR